MRACRGLVVAVDLHYCRTVGGYTVAVGCRTDRFAVYIISHAKGLVCGECHIGGIVHTHLELADDIAGIDLFFAGIPAHCGGHKVETCHCHVSAPFSVLIVP